MSTITRANAEVVLVKRCGPWMTAAGMDGTTVDGTNTDINDPLGYAVRTMGHTVGDITSITDSDLSSAAGSLGAVVDELLGLAELRLLENILGNLSTVNLTVGPRSEDYSDLAERVAERIDRLREQLESEYGYGLSVPETGVITLDFADRGE